MKPTMAMQETTRGCGTRAPRPIRCKIILRNGLDVVEGRVGTAPIVLRRQRAESRDEWTIPGSDGEEEAWMKEVVHDIQNDVGVLVASPA